MNRYERLRSDPTRPAPRGGGDPEAAAEAAPEHMAREVRRGGVPVLVRQGFGPYRSPGPRRPPSRSLTDEHRDGPPPPVPDDDGRHPGVSTADQHDPTEKENP